MAEVAEVVEAADAPPQGADRKAADPDAANGEDEAMVVRPLT